MSQTGPAAGDRSGHSLPMGGFQGDSYPVVTALMRCATDDGAGRAFGFHVLAHKRRPVTLVCQLPLLTTRLFPDCENLICIIDTSYFSKSCSNRHILEKDRNVWRNFALQKFLFVTLIFNWSIRFIDETLWFLVLVLLSIFMKFSLIFLN